LFFEGCFADNLYIMFAKGVLIHVSILEGKEPEGEIFLQTVLPVAASSFLVRFGPADFGIFGVFDDETGRAAYISGTALEKIKQQKGALFSDMPVIHKMRILTDSYPAPGPGDAQTKGILLSFMAAPGREDELEQLLIAPGSPEQLYSPTLFAMRMGRKRYGIVDIFPGNGSRIINMLKMFPDGLLQEPLSFLGSIPDMDLSGIRNGQK
jgi:hypothetical protein